MSDELARALAEGVGTFFLVLAGTGTVAADAASGGAIGPLGIAIAFGSVIAAMIYAVGPVSGAHFNPAVTLALWSVRRFPARRIPTYLVAQCVGAIGGSVAVRWVFGPHELGVTTPTISVPGAFFVEALLSFALLLVIIAGVSEPERYRAENPEPAGCGVGGIAVGLVVAVGALMGGTLTGASMNPARSLGPAVVAGSWNTLWLYWIAPIAGMSAAARVFGAMRRASLSGGDA